MLTRRLLYAMLALLVLILIAVGVIGYVVIRNEDEGGRGEFGSEFFTPEGVEGAINLLAPTSVCPTTSATQLLCLHNYARGQQNLSPLKAYSLLYKSAGLQADRIISCQEFTHYPCGESPWSKMAAVGYTRGSGENILYGYGTIRSAFSGWLSSPGHLANILNASSQVYGSAFRVGPFGLRSGTGQIFQARRLWVVQFGYGP